MFGTDIYPHTGFAIGKGGWRYPIDRQELKSVLRTASYFGGLQKLSIHQKDLGWMLVLDSGEFAMVSTVWRST